MLTVVIAAYNVEKYIDACLQSVLDQARAHRELRIIVVLDGPTDSTAERVRRLVDQYPDAGVEIISQRNRGLSAARNTGIDATRTPYVTFLDADDFWLPGYLDAILPELERSSPDILEYNALMTSDAGIAFDELHCVSGPPDRIEATTAATFVFRFRCYAWSRVYRTELFSFRRFPEGYRFEDTATIPWLYWKARLIISVPKALIAYRQRPGSILTTPTAADIHDIGAHADAAAAMYEQTHNIYWRDASLRVFQQACSRIECLPILDWLSAIRQAKTARLTAIPVPASMTRWMQMRFTLVYVCLLRVKRRLYDRLVSRIRANRFRTATRQQP